MIETKVKPEDWLEADTRTMLSIIERSGVGPVPVLTRLDITAKDARQELTAAILDWRDYYTGGGLEVSQALCYCLLKRDWGNLAMLVEQCPAIKPGLSTILRVTDEEWDELRNCKPLVECPFAAAGDYVDRLLKVR